MKNIVLMLFVTNILFAEQMITLKWEKNVTLLSFLYKNKISDTIYFNLSKTDQELCSEIYAGVSYEIVKKNNIIKDILIPISEDMQIHIFRDNNSYSIDIIPIAYTQEINFLNINISTSVFQDILEQTSNKELAKEFIKIYRQSLNFKNIQKNDQLIIKYNQKIRLGKLHGTPEIISSLLISHDTYYYAFLNPNDKQYYNENGDDILKNFFITPLKYTRISSKFSPKRFHPILKKYRAHHGVDFAAPIGRKVMASASGKIIFKGYKGGYGNTIIISHKNGYKSLYAHLNRFNKSLKINDRIQQGQLIAYVGSSGTATGPHLHFGIYKGQKPIDPLITIKTTKQFSKKDNLAIKKAITSSKEELDKIVTNQIKYSLKKHLLSESCPLAHKL